MKINGSLVFDASSASEIQNLRIEKVSSLPSFSTADTGRLIYNTSNGAMYIGVAGSTNAFVSLATGGNASALQTEVDNIEAALGSLANTDGTFNGSVFPAMNSTIWPSNPTDLTDALNTLSGFVTGNEYLHDLKDVQLSTLSNSNILAYSSTISKWTNFTIVTDGSTPSNPYVSLQAWNGTLQKLADASMSAGIVAYDGSTFVERDLVAPAAGFTITNHDGVSGNPTFALANDLAALEALSATGIAVRTGTEAWTQRSIVAPAAGITISNGDGVSGNPTLALANDLAAYEGLSTTGYVVRTGDGTATTRSIAGTSGRVVVTNGDGVSSDTNVDLATLSDDGTGSFLKFTRDSYGRVSGTTAVVTSDITALVDATYVNVAGDTMTGTLTMSSGATVTGLPSPTNSTDAVNKAYADALAQGMNVHGSVEVATTAALTATYANGAVGVGATLTNSGTNAAFVVDGYTGFVVGSRVLVKNQADGKQNGIYTVTTVGDVSTPWVLTRATDSDNHIAGQVSAGDFVFVGEGTTQASTGWTQVSIGTGTNDAIVLGTDSLSFTQSTGAGTYSAGTGLNLSGTVFSVMLGAGIASLPTSEVGIDLYSPSAGALILTDDGSTRATDSPSQLFLLLKSAGGLTQDVNGLYIPTAGVTNAMLAHSTVIVNADTATFTTNLGDTLIFAGDSTSGISTDATTAGTVKFAIADASTSQKGVAKFDSASFSVTAGLVSIKSAGVSNAQLANSSLQFGADSGSNSVVALGNTLNLAGSGAISTTSDGSHTLTVSVADATTSSKGVASFSSTDFSVTSGAVSLVAKSLSSLTDVAVTSPTAGDMLVYNSTDSKFENRKVYFLYTGASNTTHSVSHGLGQKYCNVTVVDGSDEVVIPQSITFVDSSTLTVTFNTAIACKVIVMGV